ncbi:ISAs1 family transposase [Escherichia coli]|nr:ISAs1 family transposase [Escherichia coli]
MGNTSRFFLKQYGDFENGIPVHDTIARVVSCISPAKFHECFINWMRDCHTSDDKDVIAIDGKHSGILMTRVAAGSDSCH